MAKNAQPVLAERDIKKGEPISVTRKQDYLYFVDGQGKLNHSPQNRQKLSDAERKSREEDAAKRKQKHAARLEAGRKKKAAAAAAVASRAEQRAAEARAKAEELKA